MRVLVKLLILFSFLFTSSYLMGTTSKNPIHEPRLIARHEMNIISGIIREIGLFIASEQEFIKETNKEKISKNLNELNNHFLNLKNHPSFNFQGLSLNQVIIQEQIGQVISLFNSNQKQMARAKLNSSLNLCVSCHSQSPGNLNREIQKIFSDKDVEKFKINDFEKAELYFITRDYDRSIKLYDSYIKASKKTDDDEFIFKSLERQLVYFLTIKKSFQVAKDQFSVYLKGNNLNSKIIEEIGDWVKVLSGKSLWDAYNPILAKEEEMDKFMKSFISDEEQGPIFTLTNSSEVYDINLYSILLDYYNAHPETKHGAKILYWLAVLDKRINDDLFFSIGDFYLLECMEKYPQDPVAKDCYEAYLDDMEINYLSTNKSFPPEIKLKLEKLKKLVNYKDE